MAFSSAILTHVKTCPTPKILLNKTDRGFGFNLSKIENKHVFRVVEPGGAADKAGAQPGDEIIMVRAISSTTS